MAFDLETESYTHVGRVRTNNEDSYLANSHDGLFVVCDGMGGHQAGEVASALCCEIVQRELAATNILQNTYKRSHKLSDLQPLSRAVHNALAVACKEINRRATSNPQLQGMGTTCSLVLMPSLHKAILGHVGDCRLYMLRQGSIYQLSEDHSYINAMVKRGALSLQAGTHHPQGNILSRAMGVQATTDIDTWVFDVDPNDTFLLCSDGVYNYFPDIHQLGHLMAHDALQSTVAEVIKTALERGGHDNCTAVAFRVHVSAANSKQPTAHTRIVQILDQIPLFTNLSYLQKMKLLGMTNLLEVEPGTAITHENQSSQTFYMVVSGEVELTRGGLPVTCLTAGAHFEIAALLGQAKRSVKTVARTHVCLQTLQREHFVQLIHEDPLLGATLLWTLNKIIQQDFESAMDTSRVEPLYGIMGQHEPLANK